MLRLLIFSLIFVSAIDANSQCCSPGNPVGGTTNIGILDKKAFRIISFYRHSYSEGYYENDHKSDFSFVKNGNFNYAGLVLGYGISDKMTIETELGYFINKTQVYSIENASSNKGFGFNNALVSAKYNLIGKPEKSFEWTVGLGAKFPFTAKYKVVNNVELPRDVQPSTHAFGIVAQSFLYKGFPEKGLKIFLTNRSELNFPDSKDFKAGNILQSSVFILKRFRSSNWTGIIQLRHEYRAKDIGNSTCFSCFASGTKVNSSGGQFLFIAPQINYTIAKKWNISLLADLPFYRYYNGTQLGNKYAFAVYLSRDFGGNCEVK
jgi:hypothetical protein